MEIDHIPTGHNLRKHAGGPKPGSALGILTQSHESLPYRSSPNVSVPCMSRDVTEVYPGSVFRLELSAQESMGSIVQPQYYPPGYGQGPLPAFSGPDSCAPSYDHHGPGLVDDEIAQSYGPCELMPEDQILYSAPYAIDNMTCTSPMVDDLSFDSSGSHPMCQQDSSTGFSDCPSAWSMQDCPTMSDCITLPGSQPMSVNTTSYGYSPISPAFPGLLDATPSMVVPDVKWSNPQFNPENHGSFPPQGIPEMTSLPPPGYPCDQSTIRPSHAQSRPGISDPEMWRSPDLETTDSSYNGIPYPYPNSSRRSSDGESTANARKDPLYQAVPGKDKLFHCPFEKEGCTHAPEKLKCNYDKHLDSHLKPYKCDRSPCNSLRFSSTACLLRHEREAHAMHGHGVKPYSCYFHGCDRAQPTKGFPRQWNLRDHMKRVHNFVVPETGGSPRNDYPSPPNSPDNAGGPSQSRRKRSPESSGANIVATKKTKSSSSSFSSSKGPKRESQGCPQELKAQLDRSFASLSSKELARLQRCHEQGRLPDILKDLIDRDVY